MNSRANKSPVLILISMCVLMSSMPYAQDTDDAMGAENTFWESWYSFAQRYIPIDSTLEKMKEQDPMESVNRKVFIFNDYADKTILSPIARGYQAVTPNAVEQGIGNVFSNILEITTVINDLLQGKFKQAGMDSGRFLINSTLGIAGIFDVASGLGLEKHEEDFGQTLGYWSIPPGPYVMVPLFGPYTVRSGFGALSDAKSGYIGSLEDVPSRNQLWALSIVHNRAQLLSTEELISGDRYTFVRDAYIQQRQFVTGDGVLMEDDFGEDDMDDWDE